MDALLFTATDWIFIPAYCFATMHDRMDNDGSGTVDLQEFLDYYKAVVILQRTFVD